MEDAPLIQWEELWATPEVNSQAGCDARAGLRLLHQLMPGQDCPLGAALEGRAKSLSSRPTNAIHWEDYIIIPLAYSLKTSLTQHVT
eukprot:6176852-Amphidinium_carterae.2